MNPSIPKNFFLKFFIFFLVALAAVIFIPQLEKSLFQESAAPGFITVIGVGLVLILSTAAAIYFGLKSQLNFPKLFLVFLFIYNALIIAVKFALSPLGTYNAGQWVSTVRINGDINFWIAVAAVVFILYIAIFSLFYVMAKRRYKKAVAIVNPSSEDAPKKSRFWVRLLVIAFLIWFFLQSGFLILVIPFSLFAVADGGYMLRLFFGNLYAVPLALSLLGAIYFALSSFRLASDQAIAVKDAAIIASFFWIGLSFLIVYHGLWIVYLLVLTTLWPLRVVAPSPFK